MAESFWARNGKILFSLGGKAIFDDKCCCLQSEEAVFVNMVEFNQPNLISYAAGNVPTDYHGLYDEDVTVQGYKDETPDLVRNPMPYHLQDIVIPQHKLFTLEVNWEEYRTPWIYTIKLEQGSRIGYICGCKLYSYDYKTGYVPSNGTWVQSTYVYYENIDDDNWENITYIINYPNKCYKSTYVPDYNDKLLYYSPVSGYYIFEDENYNSGIITVDSIITSHLSTVTKDVLSTYSYYNKDNFTIPITFSNTLLRGQIIDVINYSNSDLSYDDHAEIITGQITEYPGSSWAMMEHVDGSRADDLYSNYDSYNDGATLLHPRNTPIKEQTQYYFLEYLTGGTEAYCYSYITPSACVYLNNMYALNRIGGRDNVPVGDQYVNFVNDHIMFTKEGNISTYLIGDHLYEGNYFKKIPVTTLTINSYQIKRDEDNNWICSLGITGMLNNMIIYLQGLTNQYFNYNVDEDYDESYPNLFHYYGSIYLMNYDFETLTCNVYTGNNNPITNLSEQNVLTYETINVYYSNENGFYYTKNDENIYINKMIDTHLRKTRLPNYDELLEVDLPDNDYDWENYGTYMQFTLPIYYDTFNGYYFYDEQNNLIPYNYISSDVNCIYKKGSSDEIDVTYAWLDPDNDYVYIKIDGVTSSVYWNRVEGFYVHDEDDDVHINVNAKLTADMTYWYVWYDRETGDYVYDNITPVITGSGGSFDIKLYENVYRNSLTGRYYFLSLDLVPFYISNIIEPKFRYYFYDNISNTLTDITNTIQQPKVEYFSAHLLTLDLKYVGYYYFDLFWDNVSIALKHLPSRYYTGLYFTRGNTTYYIYKNPKYHIFNQGSFRLRPDSYCWLLGTLWNTLSCFTSNPHKQLTINEGYYINYEQGFKPIYYDSNLSGWWMPIKNGDVIASTFIEHNSEITDENTPPPYYYDSDVDSYCKIESGKYVFDLNGVDCNIIRPINYYEVEFGYPINEYTRSGKCDNEQYRWMTKYKYKNNNPLIKYRKFSYSWENTTLESNNNITNTLTVADVLNNEHLNDSNNDDTYYLYDSVIEPTEKHITKNHKLDVSMIQFKKMTAALIENIRVSYDGLYDMDEIENDLTNVNSINCLILTALWLSKGTHPFRAYVNLDYNTTDGYFCKNPFQINGSNLTHLSHGELSLLTDGNSSHDIQWSNDAKVYFYELNSTCTILTTNVLSAQLNYKSDIYYSAASSMYYCYNPYNSNEIISGIVDENIKGETFFDTDGEEYNVNYNTSTKKFYYTKNSTTTYLTTEDMPLFKGLIDISNFKHSVYGFSDKFAVNYGIRKQGYITKTFNFDTNYMIGFNISNYDLLILFLKNDTSPILVGYVNGTVWRLYWDGQSRWLPYPWRDITKSVQPITATVRDYFSSISSLFTPNANYVMFRDANYIREYQYLSFYRPISTSSLSGDSEDSDIVDGSTFVPSNTLDF